MHPGTLPNTKCKKTCAFVGYASARLEEADPHDVREPLPGLGEQALFALPGTGDTQMWRFMVSTNIWQWLIQDERPSGPPSPVPTAII